MINQIDFLLVGHGLAGALLAHQLHNRGQRVVVIDGSHSPNASRVAAGIINPVTGHRLNITEGFNTYFSTANTTYKRFERTFNRSVFSSMNQLRLLKNEGQYTHYQQRCMESRYDNVFGQYNRRASAYSLSAYGTVEIKNTALIDTNNLLDASEQHLRKLDAYLSTNFNYSQLSTDGGVVSYQGLNANQIIFCEGHQARKNPWLANLPFKLAKGEIVDVELTDPVVKFLNWGQWIIPGRNSGENRLGSTYDWNDLSLNSTQTNKLLKSLEMHIGAELIGHSTKVGIRPTTVHRVPFVGAISALERAYCFNGFGSKGCLLIPYYAEQLCAHILDQKPLPEKLTQWL